MIVIRWKVLRETLTNLDLVYKKSEILIEDLNIRIECVTL